MRIRTLSAPWAVTDCPGVEGNASNLLWRILLRR